MSITPLRIVSRSESAAKRCGSHESVAMLAMTRGPSRKPACAATKSSAPSLKSAAMTNALPDVRCRRCSTPPATRSKSTAFIVLPSLRLRVHEQVREQDAAGGDGERRRP